MPPPHPYKFSRPLWGSLASHNKSHASLFFTSYKNFDLNQNAAPTKEFSRLKKLNGWKDGNKEYDEARKRFANALAKDFNSMYGTDINNLDRWHVLCHILRINPVPEGISACREVRMWLNELMFGPSRSVL
jgi:hypothetical protein